MPFAAGMATASGSNNTLYMFGGESSTNASNSNLYQLTQTGNTFAWSFLRQSNSPPVSIYGQAVITNDNSKMYVFGGMKIAVSNQTIPLQYYEYTFDTNTWSNASTNTITNTTNITSTREFPLNRRLFSATYDNNNRIYIYGGALNQSIVFSDFYVMDITTRVFKRLPDPKIHLYGHTASLLSNGQIVIIGGVIINESYGLGGMLAPINQTYIYDTITNQWDIKITQATNRRFPSTRVGHNAVVTPDDKIVIFGGSNGGDERTAQFLNDVAILDTKLWLWDRPNVGGITPSRMAYSSAGLINSTYLVVGFGVGSNVYYNAINVFDLSTNSWLQSFDYLTNSSGDLSAGAIAGIVIASISIFVALFFCVWKFRSCKRWFSRRIIQSIWRPRAGEPVWTEVSRLICQVLLFAIFIIFITFNVRQTITSPSIIQIFEEPTTSVQVPDVRFCFDGYPIYPNTDSRSTGVTCQTDMGYSCNKFVKPLDMAVFRPIFATRMVDLQCYMFRAPTDFALTGSSGNNNGSKLMFTLFADPNVQSGLVHTSVYHRKSNPNVLKYDDYEDDISSLSIGDALDVQFIEHSENQVANVFTLTYSTQNALSYKLVTHQYLQDVGWNYVGFLPITTDSYQVTTSFRQNTFSAIHAQTNSAKIGHLTVFPDAFVQTFEREVRVYNLLTVLGFVGGVLGLLVAAQVWLFGFRPKSPFGIVQRWSVGNMKQSLQRSLRSNFEISNSGIPLVHPVQYKSNLADFCDANHEPDEIHRINHVEGRIQMLETLFKTYYVDDEVFRSIEDANKRPIKSKNKSDSCDRTSCEYNQSCRPQTERLVGSSRSDTTEKYDIEC
ncbi:hypothetical protein MBANPS3_000345 [Mucor bainieri]